MNRWKYVVAAIGSLPLTEILLWAAAGAVVGTILGLLQNGLLLR